jgi:Arc/MetJ family transcription regulator
MRTNIVIDDTLMDAVMATGDYKTKREAVEAGLRLIQRRKAYAAIRAARGTLHWDDSDEAWAQYRADQSQAEAGPAGAVHEATAPYLPAAGRGKP